ncbi:hypothetical protein ACLE20_10505 [Rhizobium sp. YIM 134829]|uniref:hypothetical protein n=1 Tax=Rhizobium sp. YIM 134829 TaxID=3390453 RepID=UPI00397C4E85
MSKVSDAAAAGSPAPAARLMPFHATFLALTVPPVAAVLTLQLFGAAPLGPGLIASVLPPAYLIGAAPAFLGGRLDGVLARRGWRLVSRLTLAAGLSGLAGLLILAPLFLTGRTRGALPLLAPAAFAAAAVAALGLAMLLARLPTFIADRRKPPEGPR